MRHRSKALRTSSAAFKGMGTLASTIAEIFGSRVTRLCVVPPSVRIVRARKSIHGNFQHPDTEFRHLFNNNTLMFYGTATGAYETIRFQS